MTVPRYLYLTPKDDDVELLLTPTTRYEYAARGEAALRLLQRGQIVQLERRDTTSNPYYCYYYE